MSLRPSARRHSTSSPSSEFSIFFKLWFPCQMVSHAVSTPLLTGLRRSHRQTGCFPQPGPRARQQLACVGRRTFCGKRKRDPLGWSSRRVCFDSPRDLAETLMLSHSPPCNTTTTAAMLPLLKCYSAGIRRLLGRNRPLPEQHEMRLSSRAHARRRTYVLRIVLFVEPIRTACSCGLRRAFRARGEWIRDGPFKEGHLDQRESLLVFLFLLYLGPRHESSPPSLFTGCN